MDLVNNSVFFFLIDRKGFYRNYFISLTAV